MELSSQSAEITKVAVVVDVREREFLKEFPSVLNMMRAAAIMQSLYIWRHLTISGRLARQGEDIRLKKETVLARNKERKGNAGCSKNVSQQNYRHLDYNAHQLKDVMKDYFSGPHNMRKCLSILFRSATDMVFHQMQI